ncbi:hypothetical protein SeMB42_g02797 [Synchytrium endobioticum]|uniref:C3HC-type domain-containing protein n=1 Tax=Synchytrium endobioticum TaxID=286115 RepID=A0A507DC40_9FUNG|nr:hypothetical protein SeMB42_g02797 [Synchytrium endobioticum]
MICAYNTTSLVLRNREDDGVKAITAKFVEQLTNQHSRACVWKITAIDKTLCRFPLRSSASTVRAFERRYKSFQNLLPYHVPITKFDLDQSTIETLYTLARLSSATSSTPACTSITEFDKSCLGLALYGWQAEEQHGDLNFARCFLCMRSVGLWNFKKVDTPEGCQVTPLSKKKRPSEGVAVEESLDVKAQHRWFCPWVYNELIGSTSSAEYSKKVGWEITLDSLLQSASSTGTNAISPSSRHATTGGSTRGSEDVLSRMKEASNLVSSLLRQRPPTKTSDTLMSSSS